MKQTSSEVRPSFSQLSLCANVILELQTGIGILLTPIDQSAHSQAMSVHARLRTSEDTNYTTIKRHVKHLVLPSYQTCPVGKKQ
jgi:hypothetical protein